MDDENDRWIPEAEAIRLKPLALSGGYLLLR
jgi:hypothetical protein